MLAALIATIAHALTVSAPACAPEAGNVLRYGCEATTDVPARTRVRLVELGSADSRTTAWSASGTTHDQRLWNLKASTTYRVLAEARDPATGALVRSAPTTFTTGALSFPPFTDLTLRAAARPGDAATFGYVLFPLSCNSDEVLVVVDTAGEVVWYQELPDGGEGVHALAVDGTSVLVQVDLRANYEIGFDGAVLRAVDHGAAGECSRGFGPCPHHELRVDEGATWSGVASMDPGTYGALGLSGCSGKRRYAVDALRRYDPTWTTWTDYPLADFGFAPDFPVGPDFDPSVPDPGCENPFWTDVLGNVPPIDPHHLNAFDVLPGNRALISLPEWSSLAMLDLSSSSVLWTLHGSDPAYSSFAVPLDVDPSIVEHGTPDFSGQHHASWDAGGVVMLDNVGEGGVTRALRVRPDPAAGVATIEQVHTLVTDDAGTWASPATQLCRNRGSVSVLDSGHVLTTCPSAQTISELDQPDGTTANGPRWFLEATCAAGPAGGFYRVVPLDSLGL
jgi:hypothetical protein